MTKSTNEMGWRAATVLSEDSPVDLDMFLDGKVAKPQRTHPALSLFSNAGVGDFGYRLAGFTFHVHAELVKSRLQLCGNNHPRSALIEGDLTTTWRTVVKTYRQRCSERPTLLTAMPPCQGMSSGSNSDRSGKTSDDPRNVLSFLVAKVARELQPDFVVVENVAGMLFTRVKDPETGDKGIVAKLLADRMEGYDAYACTIQFADYGVPQRRLRTIFTFVREGSPASENLSAAERYPYPRPTHARHEIPGRKPWVTVREFLERQKLVPLSASPTWRAADDKDLLHAVPRLDDRRFLWVAKIPKHTGRGAFQNGCIECDLDDIPTDNMKCPGCGATLVARPHMIVDGHARKIRGHLSSYRRMRSDMPATTITTATGHLGSDVNIHPWENRLLSPRECALLQTIPYTFDWTVEEGEIPPSTHLRAMIGEALPPWYGYLHGLALRVAIAGTSTKRLLPGDAAECQTLDYATLEDLQFDRRRRLHRARHARPERRLDEIEA